MSTYKLLGAGALSAAAVAGLTAYGVHGRSAQIFGPSVYRGVGKRKSIALTFDDGPSPGTLELLDYLATQDVPATFFQCGTNVRRHPAVARAVLEAGHEIGNHTYSHPQLSPRIGFQINWRSPSFIKDEIGRTQHVIRQETGFTPRLFRAPYGLRWYGLRAAQRSHNLLGVMWTVIAHDWEWRGADITRYVLNRTAAGGILCFHDGRDTRPLPDISQTLQSVRQLIPALKDQGYRFETVSELLRPDHPA